jgi:hypothetical protein
MFGIEEDPPDFSGGPSVASSRLLKNPLGGPLLLKGLPANPTGQGNLFDKAA